MKRLIAILLLVSGCAHVHLACPTTGTQMVSLGGNNLMNFIQGAASAAAFVGPLLAAKPVQVTPTPPKLGAAGPGDVSTFDLTTLDLFPATYYCGSQPPVSASGNTTVIVNPVPPVLAPVPSPAARSEAPRLPPMTVE